MICNLFGSFGEYCLVNLKGGNSNRNWKSRKLEYSPLYCIFTCECRNGKHLWRKGISM